VKRLEDRDAIELYFGRHERLILASQEDEEDEEPYVLDEIINLCLECHDETAMSAEETAARRRHNANMPRSTDNIQLYLPPAASDRASGRIDLQINGITVAEWHDKLIRRECEISKRAKDEITKVIWEHWKITQSEYH